MATHLPPSHRATYRIYIQITLADQPTTHSGEDAIFYTNVGGTKEPVSWIDKLDNESTQAYLERTLKQAQEKKTGLAQRQGLGRSFLGLRGQGIKALIVRSTFRKKCGPPQTLKTPRAPTRKAWELMGACPRLRTQVWAMARAAHTPPLKR